MRIPREQFEELMNKAIDNLPEKFLAKINNLAFFIEDFPTKEQIKKSGLKSGYILYGLYEGYHQSKKLNIGPVLPDKITLFAPAIMSECQTEEEVAEKIQQVIKHEIAHHFGSDEAGAKKAEK